MNHNLKPVISFISAFVLIISCTGQPADELPGHIKKLENLTVYPVLQQTDTVYLEREQTFGETDDLMIGTLGGVAVDNTGRVLIEDRDQHTIHLFHPDGEYDTNIGREGKGPGEFSNFRDLPLQVKDDELITYDPSQQKFTIFALDSLSLSTTINLDPQNWSTIEALSGSTPGSFFGRSDSTIMIGFEIMNTPDDRLVKYYQIDRRGRLISDKLLEHENIDLFAGEAEGRKIVMKLPFSRKPLVAVSDNDHLFLAWSEDFLIKEYDENGHYLRSFYYPFVNRELSREEIINSYSASFARKAVQQAEFPETWPAIYDMKVDDEGRLWVSTIVDDQEVYQWWILKRDGELLARFKWAREKTIEEIKNGMLYTRETDEETGLDEIVRYRIGMSGG